MYNFENVHIAADYQAAKVLAAAGKSPSGTMPHPQSYIFASEQVDFARYANADGSFAASASIDQDARGKQVCEQHALAMGNPALVGVDKNSFKDDSTSPNADTYCEIPWTVAADLSNIDESPGGQAFESMKPSVWGKSDNHYCCLAAGLGCAVVSPPKSQGPAVSWSNDRVDLFYRTAADTLGYQWYDGTTWSGHVEALNPTNTDVASAPAAISWGKGQLEVFYRTQTGLLAYQQYDAQSWHLSVHLSGALAGAPRCRVLGAESYRCLYAVPGGTLGISGTTTARGRITLSRLARAGSPLRRSRCHRAVGRLDVFYQSTDAREQHAVTKQRSNCCVTATSECEETKKCARCIHAHSRRTPERVRRAQPPQRFHRA